MALDIERKERTINPLQEFLTGGVLSEYYGFPAFGATGDMTLFPTNDEILLRQGFRVYEEMMKDPKCSKNINVLKIITVADGVEIVPCFSESNPEYQQALKVQKLCTAAVKNLKIPIKQILEEMLDALIYGYRIAEVNYEMTEIPDETGIYMLPKSIKVKPFGAAKFVVDKFYNIVGIAGATALSTLKPNSDDLVGISKVTEKNVYTKGGDVYIRTGAGEFKFLNRDKFLILTIRPRNNDPRGTSFLKAAFQPWWLKSQVYPEYLRYLLICAIPLLVGFTPPDESIAAEILKDGDGNPILDSNGNFVRFNPVAALRSALVEARNATAIALKGGSQVTEVGNKGNNGVAFYKAIEILNEEIESAILLQTLATSESRFNTRAASQTHMSVLDNVVWYIKETLADMLINDLFKVIIEYNLGKEWLKYMPEVTLGDIERRQFAHDATAIANLFKVGFFTKSQLKKLYSMMGLPLPDDFDELYVPELNTGGNTTSGADPELGTNTD